MSSSPMTFSDPPEGTTGSRIALCSVLLRMGFTCAPAVTGRAVVSYTAFPPFPCMQGSLFLLHFPWSHLHRTLSGILPCEARTFLVCALSGPAAAIARPAYILMHFTRESDSCQLRRGNILRLQIPSEVNSWGPPPCLRRQSTQGTLKVSSPRNKPARSVLR